MKVQRVVLTAVAAGALVIAAGCRSARTSSTTATTDNGAYSSSSTTAVADTGTGTTDQNAVGVNANTNTTANSSSTSYNSGSTNYNSNNNNGSMASSTTMQSNMGSTQSNIGTTTTDANGVTTTIVPNGTITKSSSTTIVYPDGTVKTVNGDNANMTSSTGTTTTTGTTAVAGAPGTVTTRTVTTITTKTTAPPSTTIVQTVPANNTEYVPGQPMTSSTTTIYQPSQRVFYRGRRHPDLDFLAFADRASFSTNNRSLNGTVNTGALGTDIRNENGWGLGFNKYFGTHLSTEFTASRIRPKATLTPFNAAVNPITGLRLKMTPITGTLQAHFNPWSSIDLNIGAGAAYVMFKADNSFNPGTSGLTAVNFRDEWGPLVNAGLSFNMSRNFGVRFDAKYMWVRAHATTTFNDGVAVVGNVGNSEHFGLNPFVLSAGLRFGF